MVPMFRSEMVFSFTMMMKNELTLSSWARSAFTCWTYAFIGVENHWRFMHKHVTIWLTHVWCPILLLLQNTWVSNAFWRHVYLSVSSGSGSLGSLGSLGARSWIWQGPSGCVSPMGKQRSQEWNHKQTMLEYIRTHAHDHSLTPLLTPSIHFEQNPLEGTTSQLLHWRWCYQQRIAGGHFRILECQWPSRRHGRGFCLIQMSNVGSWDAKKQSTQLDSDSLTDWFWLSQILTLTLCCVRCRL